MGAMTGRFPAPVYRETVLAPLFEGVKQHHWRQQMRDQPRERDHAGRAGPPEPGGGRRRSCARLDDIERGTDIAALTYTGEHEDFFFLVQTELERRLGVETAGKLHTGRSRNDIDHTVFKMALKERPGRRSSPTSSAAIGAVLDVAEANRDTLVVAYTHGQPAQPTTYGHYLGRPRRAPAPRRGAPAPGEPLSGPLEHGRGGDHDLRLPARPRGDGGAPGFAGVQDNAYGCIAADDYLTSVYGALQLLFVHLGRFAQDLNAWTGLRGGTPPRARTHTSR